MHIVSISRKCLHDITSDITFFAVSFDLIYPPTHIYIMPLSFTILSAELLEEGHLPGYHFYIILICTITVTFFGKSASLIFRNTSCSWLNRSHAYLYILSLNFSLACFLSDPPATVPDQDDHKKSADNSNAYISRLIIGLEGYWFSRPVAPSKY